MKNLKIIRITLWIIIIVVIGFLTFSYMSDNGNPIKKYSESKKLTDEMDKFYKKSFTKTEATYVAKSKMYSVTLTDEKGIKTNAWFDNNKLHTDYPAMMWATEIKNQYNEIVQTIFPSYTFTLVPTILFSTATTEAKLPTSYYENHDGYGLLFDIRTNDLTYDEVKQRKEKENERIFSLIQKLQEGKTSDISLIIRYKDSESEKGYIMIEATQLPSIHSAKDIDSFWAR